MNPLTDPFPQSVLIYGKEYEINTDFRIGVDIMLAFEDKALSEADKQRVMLELLYKEIPPDLASAQEMAVLFLNCGEEERGEASTGARNMRVYSFEKDAKYIYSAFRQTHGIDLESIDYLHWWKFCYMFLDLNPDTMFQQMVSLRQRKQLNKLTKEERELYQRMEHILELPELKDAETLAAEAEFMSRLTLSNDGHN